MISAAAAHALQDIAQREHDLAGVFTPGAVPTRSDVAQASSSRFTLDPLSVAPPPQAYFITRDDRGRSVYSRDGAFRLQDGRLVDAAGHAVLGYPAAGGGLAALLADRVDTALRLTDDLRIEADGAVTYARSTIDPRTGARDTRRGTLGRIALARFAAGTKLVPSDAAHFLAPAGIVPHLGSPADGNFAPVEPHRREGSGVNIDRGLERLEEAYLALDALRAAEHARGSAQKTTMDLLK